MKLIRKKDVKLDKKSIIKLMKAEDSKKQLFLYKADIGYVLEYYPQK